MPAKIDDGLTNHERWLAKPGNRERAYTRNRVNLGRYRQDPAYRESANAATKAWYAENKDKVNARRRAAKLIETPEERASRLTMLHAWYETPEGFAKVKAGNRRRRERARQVLVIETTSDMCGVCGDTLVDTQYPDPMCTTVGHEPPLSRTQPGDTVITRPEHYICNLRKHNATDAELMARIA